MPPVGEGIGEEGGTAPTLDPSSEPSPWSSGPELRVKLPKDTVYSAYKQNSRL